jgi:Fe-S-cluster containining protein
MKIAIQAAGVLRHDLEKKQPIFRLATSTNALADVILSRVGSKSTCSKGCSHCCQQSTILIDDADAELLSIVSGRSINLIENQKKQNWRGVNCVFLDTNSNSCTVYESRPMACRASLSLDDPMKCRTEELRDMVMIDSVYLELIGLVGERHFEAYKLSRGKTSRDIREYFTPNR